MGGSGNDNVVSIVPISNGYIMGGLTTSNDGDVPGNHGGYDVWIVKVQNP